LLDFDFVVNSKEVIGFFLRGKVISGVKDVVVTDFLRFRAEDIVVDCE